MAASLSGEQRNELVVKQLGIEVANQVLVVIGIVDRCYERVQLVGKVTIDECGVVGVGCREALLTR